MKKRLKLFSLVLMAIFVSTARGAEGDVKVLKDISYLAPDREEKMDAYIPPESFQRPVPAVLLIHGGGWKIGDKADKREQNIGSTLASNGYAVFSINYILQKPAIKDEQGKVITPASKVWPQNFYECKTALRYMKKEAATYGIDSSKIAVMGGSAGGHLAMLVGATQHVEDLNSGGLYTEQNNDIRCIINLYGIHDLRKFKGNSPFFGATKEETEENLTKASPKTYFGKDTQPILILHGNADKIVGIEMAYDLVKILQEKEIPHKFVEVPGAPHTFHLQPKEMDLRPIVLEFLRENLK